MTEVVLYGLGVFLLTLALVLLLKWFFEWKEADDD